MEYGFQFANLEPARVRDLARVAEGEGYDLIVFPDHVVLEGAEGVYDPHALAYDVVQLATVVATATSRIRVGHLVAQMFHVTPEILAASPAVFIGTPKQCVVELTRRAEHWDVSQFIFGAAMGIDENQIRRLRKEVIAQI